MGSVLNDDPSQSGKQRLLFENTGRNVTDRETGAQGLGSNPNIPLQTELSPSTQMTADINLHPVPALHKESVWSRRIKLVIFVLFCVELGMLLIVLPWKPVWTENSLLITYPNLRAVILHYFTRGAVTGLGLIDVWIGIWAAAQYREKK